MRQVLSTSRVVVVCSALAFAAGAPAAELHYPETKRSDHVDVYHGTEVADPYRWLENDVRESEPVQRWVDAQNEITFSYLESIPAREAIQQRLTELWNYEKYSTPFKSGGRYLFFKNDGLQNQFVLYTHKRLDEPARVLIDPNEWSEDGTVALRGTAVSNDGRYLAYGVANAGSDWRKWKILEIDTGKTLDETLDWIKFNQVSWTADSRGFFYGRYQAPEEGQEFQSLNLGMRVFYHRVGTEQADDVLVYAKPEHPAWGFGTKVTDDGRYLVITTWKGTDSRYRIAYKDLQEPYGIPVDLIDNFDHEYTFVGNDGPVFFFLTNRDADRRRLIAIDVRNPEPENWREIVSEAADTLVDVDFVGNLFVARYLQDAKTQVKLYTMTGRHLRDVAFPGIGSATGFGGRRMDTETFYSFSSFATPPSVYRYDLLTGESSLLRQATVDFDPNDFEVNQVFFESKDGTRVPMFIAHRSGLDLDDNPATLLYGYGGFDIPLTPSFSISRLAWMEMGGVFAMANLRGGGEYGETWHKAGTKLSKQNVFDDFIAAAEWLLDNGYATPATLGIQGGSNGGLLVGAAMTQRPDLFGACLPAVGVMDMLRFHKFTAGRFWVDDYGSADDPQEFTALRAYSPYHNLKRGTAYPATLVTTADTDDRVVPGHSFKFAAALQHAHAGNAPVLIRIETRAGHGAGTPTTKLIEAIADQWAFLVANLGLEVPAKGARLDSSRVRGKR